MQHIKSEERRQPYGERFPNAFVDADVRHVPFGTADLHQQQPKIIKNRSRTLAEETNGF